MSQQTLRRTIHPVVCVLDEKNFIAEFTASDETIDLTNEVIRAAGWRFNLAKKNFPFVNSHDYSDIRNMIGRVVDFGVVAGKLMNTVQYACDVAENQLAKFAWKMTVAKYLPAVSVGCVPLLMATRWDSDKKLYNAQRAELKLARDVMPDVIYIEQEQIELSQCIIGANPNAIAQIEKAYQAGILNDSDITHFSKMSRDFARAFEQHNHRPRAYSFPDSKPAAAVTRMLEALGGEESTNQPAIKTHMQKHDFLKNFSRLTGDTKAMFENLEFTRRGGNETENQTALRITAASLRREQCLAGDPVDRYFAAHPLEKAFWNVAARKFAGAGLKVGSAEEEIWREYTKAVKSFQQGISPVDHFGGGMFPIPVSPDIFDLLFIYGAFKDLGVTEMPGQFSKFVVVNGRPTVLVYPADQQGNITAPAAPEAGNDAKA